MWKRSLPNSMALTALLLCSTIPVSHAALVDNGTFTSDTATSLDWLDLTETNGLSYNYVSSQLGTGGQWAGWRYATSAEATGVLQTLGFTIGYASGTIASAPAGYSTALTSFVELFGDTYREYAATFTNPDDYRGAEGVILQSDSPDTHQSLGAYISYGSLSYSLNTDPATACCDRNDGQGGLLWYGHFLVRDSVAPVPLPAAAWLLLSGLAGVGTLGRRRKSA